MDDIPRPSAWPARLGVAATSLLGAVVSSYDALAESGRVQNVWRHLLDVHASVFLENNAAHLFPLSDASTRIVVYALAFVTSLVGSADRAPSRHWIMGPYAVFAWLLPAANTVVVLAQPVFRGEWCVPCLVAILLAILSFDLSMDEVTAWTRALRDRQAAARLGTRRR